MHKVVIGYEIFDQISYCSKYYIKVVAFCKHRNKYANGSFNSMCTTKTLLVYKTALHGPSAPKSYITYQANVCFNTGRKEASRDGRY